MFNKGKVRNGKKIFLVFLVFLSMFTFVSADFGYVDSTKPNLVSQPKDYTITINDSTLNVNNSDLLDGYHYNELPYGNVYGDGSANQLCYWNSSGSVKGLSGSSINNNWIIYPYILSSSSIGSVSFSDGWFRYDDNENSGIIRNRIDSDGDILWDFSSASIEGRGDIWFSGKSIASSYRTDLRGIRDINVSRNEYVDGNISAPNYCTNGVCGNVTDFINTGTSGAYNVSYESTYNSSYLTGYDSNIAWENESNTFTKQTNFTADIKVLDACIGIQNRSAGGSDNRNGTMTMCVASDNIYGAGQAVYVDPPSNTNRWYWASRRTISDMNFAGVSAWTGVPRRVLQSYAADTAYCMGDAHCSILGNGNSNLVFSLGDNGYIMSTHGSSGNPAGMPLLFRSFANNTNPYGKGMMFNFDTKATAINGGNQNHTAWTTNSRATTIMTLDMSGNLKSYGNMSAQGYVANNKVGKTTSTTVITSVDFLGSVTTSCTLNITGGIINTDSTC